MIELVEAQRDRVRQRYGRATKYLFPVFHGKRELFIGNNWTLQELKILCLRHGIIGREGKPFDFLWHPLRHHRGTQMAAEGHDILSIMFELGYTSQDMASMYVNKRLDLKKNALLRKESMLATRVCGGACMLPEQLGEWCEHAHACLTCRFFRADADDVEHFRCERAGLYAAIPSRRTVSTRVKSSATGRPLLGRKRRHDHGTGSADRNTQRCPQPS